MVPTEDWFTPNKCVLLVYFLVDVYLRKFYIHIFSVTETDTEFVNTLRPRQNGRHFPDDNFKRIFVNENV